MKFKTPDSRKFLLVFAVFAMIVALFAYYLLVYIPERKQEIDKRGLRILDQVSRNLIEKNQSYVHSIFFTGSSINNKESGTKLNLTSFKTDLTKQFSHEEMVLDSISNLEEENFRNNYLYHSLEFTSKKLSDSLDITRIIKVQKGFILDSLSEKVKLSYRVKVEKEEKNSSKSSAPQVLFLDFDFNAYMNSVVGYRHDFFESYALIEDSKIRYQSSHLLTETKELDSLDKTISKKGPLIPLILEGQNYMVFLKQFYFGGKSVYLCGLIKEDQYEQNQYGIQPYALWNLCTIFFLLLCTLPLIKFFTITKFERLRYSDGLAMTVASFLFFAMFSIWISGVLFWNKKKSESIARIKTINDSVNTRFTNEVDTALASLDIADSSYFYNMVSNSDADLDSVMRQQLYNALLYIDSNGISRHNYYLNLTKTSFADVKARNYYKRIRNQNGYYRQYGKPYFVESILSWDKPDNFGVISIKSEHPDLTDKISVIAIRQYMQSVQDVILPSGYGMCMINNNGTVLFHSQKLRILKENFIEECDEGTAKVIRNFIQQTLKTNSSTLSANFNTLYYGRTINGHVKKVNVDGLPFYIVTYVSETSIGQEVFNVVFCTTLVVFPFLIFLFFVFLLFYWISFRPTLLESDKIDLRWLNINPTNRHSLILLGLYTLIITILAIVGILLPEYYDKSEIRDLDGNLFLILWTSFLGFTGMPALLYLNYRYCNEKKTLRFGVLVRHYHNFIWICVVILILLIYLQWLLLKYYSIVITCSFACLILILILYRIKTKNKSRDKWILPYFRDTSIFAFVITLLIFFFSVVPVLYTFEVFSDYFYQQQEMRNAQSVKNMVHDKLKMFNSRNDSMYVNFPEKDIPRDTISLHRNDSIHIHFPAKVTQASVIEKANYSGIDTIMLCLKKITGEERLLLLQRSD